MTGQRFVLWLMLLYLVRVDGACQESDGMDAVCPDKCECWPQGAGRGITVDCQRKGLENVPRLPVETAVVLLNDNEIEAISHKDFRNCSNLHTLDLSGNSIWSVEHMSFQDTSNLSILRLLTLVDALPPGIFDYLYNIVELQLYGGEFSYRGMAHTYDILIEDLLRNKSRLERLGIGIVTNTSLSPIFSKLVSLKSLHIELIFCSNVDIDTFSALQNVSLQEMVIYYQVVCSLNIKALSYLRSLTTFKLVNWGGASNSLNTGHIDWPSLKHTNIQKVILHGSTYGTDHYDILGVIYDLIGTSVTELHVADGEVGTISCKIEQNSLYYQCPAAGLEKLSMERISWNGEYSELLNTFSFLPDLVHLNIKQSQALLKEYVIPNDCRELYLAPKLVTLNMSYVIASSEDLSCIRFHINPAAVMDHIDMSHNKFTTLNWHILAKPNSVNHVFERINIRHFNVTSCHIKHMALVHDYPVYIQSMDLSSNNLANFLASDYAMFSSNLESVHLRDLSLSNNVIKMLPVEIFQNSTSLQNIDLSDNSLSSWQVSLVALENISSLDLSNNLLSFLDDKTTNELTNIANDHVVSINLAGNPLVCQCSNLPFLRWLHQARNTLDKGVHVMNIDSYSCTLIDGKRGNFSNLTDIIQAMDVSCKSSTWVIVSGTTLGIVLLVIILVTAIYRNRWNIRYVWLRVTRQRKEDQDRNNERQYKYDAFIAYHQDDLDWIVHVLLPRLETGQEPLRLCVHHRNWLPGPTIEENISKSVEVSRKTLVILTKNFLRSGWCELELQLARMRGLEEGKDITLVVALEEIPLRQMSTTLANLRQNNTWLDWYEYENDRQQFWELLSEALSGPRVLRNRTGNQGEERDDIYLIT